MKTKISGWKLCAIAIAAFLTVMASVGEVHAGPPLAMQPAYAGRSFYVYQPYRVSRNWYTTYDGYPVRRNVGLYPYVYRVAPLPVATTYTVPVVTQTRVITYPAPAATTYVFPVAVREVVPVKYIIRCK